MTTPAATLPDRHKDRHKVVPGIMNFIVLVLSVILIIWISSDTFSRVDLLYNRRYMNFQLWVCVVFIVDFFVELFYADNKKKYCWHRTLFLLLSIPYLNILEWLHVPLGHEALYFIRFIPLARGALALAIVMGYLSRNAVTSMFLSYLSIMILVGYFCSLIFYQQEAGVNPQVHSYWDALWWTAMNLTTVGCNIEPVTVSGKITAVVLPVCGMIVFPLFTVYLTNYVTQMVKSNLNS